MIMHLAFKYNAKNANDQKHCLVYHWSGAHFDIMDEMVCTHATNIEPFVIGPELYIAVANYRNEIGLVNY